jgi:hypothetical protein
MNKPQKPSNAWSTEFNRDVVKGDGTGFRLCHFFRDELKGLFQGPKRGANRATIFATSDLIKAVCNPRTLLVYGPSQRPDRNPFRASPNGTKGLQNMPLCATFLARFGLLNACNDAARRVIIRVRGQRSLAGLIPVSLNWQKNAGAKGFYSPLPPCGGGIGWGVALASDNARQACLVVTGPPPQPSSTSGEGVRTCDSQ